LSRWAGKALLFAFLVGLSAPANAVIQTALPQLLPLPAPVPAPAPAPIPPPINPGYVASPADGLSPVLSQSVPVYQLPQPLPPSYPPPQVPGPIDQQKMQAYRNDLRAQQWQLQSQGLATSSPLGREIQRQLNTPDAQ
jgi:hypothetical protein